MNKSDECIKATNSKFESVISREELLIKIDELKFLTKTLNESESRLNRAQALAHVGNWELDIENNKIWASEEAFRLYSY
jgi:hypothetical protein